MMTATTCCCAISKAGSSPPMSRAGHSHPGRRSPRGPIAEQKRLFRTAPARYRPAGIEPRASNNHPPTLDLVGLGQWGPGSGQEASRQPVFLSARRPSPICRWQAALRPLKDDPRGRSGNCDAGGRRSADRPRMENRCSGRSHRDGRRPLFQLREAPPGYASKQPGERPRPGAGITVSAARCRDLLSLTIADIVAGVVIFAIGDIVFSRRSLRFSSARSPVLTPPRRR